MERGSFFKSLAALIVAPKILAKIDWTKAITKAKPSTISLFKDLQLLQPAWYKDYAKKYGNENYMDILRMMGEVPQVTSRYFHYWDSQTGEIFKNAEPISATITL